MKSLLWGAVGMTLVMILFGGLVARDLGQVAAKRSDSASQGQDTTVAPPGEDATMAPRIEDETMASEVDPEATSPPADERTLADAVTHMESCRQQQDSFLGCEQSLPVGVQVERVSEESYTLSGVSSAGERILAFGAAGAVCRSSASDTENCAAW